jgi:hypothetical protein
VSVPTVVSPSPAVAIGGLCNVLPSVETNEAADDTGSDFVDDSDNNNLFLPRGRKRRNKSSATYRCLVSSAKLKR